MELVTTNGTGTGELIMTIQTVDKIPLSAGFLLEAKKPGSYGERLSIDTTPDPDCDPTRSEEPRLHQKLNSQSNPTKSFFLGQCELWIEGTYNVTVVLCNGQCGSKHPHTAVYGVAHGSFSLYEE